MILHSDPYFKYVQMMMIPNEFRIFYSNVMGWNHHPPSTFAGRSAGPQLRRAGKKGQSLLGMVAATEERIIPAGYIYTHTYIYIIESYSGACSGLQHCANVPTVFFGCQGDMTGIKNIKKQILGFCCLEGVHFIMLQSVQHTFRVFMLAFFDPWFSVIEHDAIHF